MTSSSRSASVKSNRTGSGHNVELGHHGNGYDSPASGGGNSGQGVGPTPVSEIPGNGGTAAVSAKEERKNKVGQNVSEDEEEEVSSHDGTPSSGPGSGPGNARAGYQSF